MVLLWIWVLLPCYHKRILNLNKRGRLSGRPLLFDVSLYYINQYFSGMQKQLKNLPIILCYIIAFVFGIKQMREPDIWWQLLSGKWMLEHGQVTHSDIFSYTMSGVRWVNVKWLYEVVIAGIEKVFGPEGIMLLQGLVNMAILWALLQTLKQVRKYWQIPVSGFFTIISVLLFFIAVEYRMAGRPEMISHLMCALMLWWFFKNPQLQWKQLIVPVVLQCLWANMHEGYPIGIVMIGTFGVGSVIAYFLNKDDNYLRTAGRAGLLLGLSILVLLINPNGWQLWLQPFEIFRQVNVNKYTTELYSAWQPEYWTIQAKIYIGMLVLVIAFWIARLMQANKENDNRFKNPVTVFYLLLILLFGYLSLTANRNIPFTAITLFPSLPVMMAWAIDKWKIYRSGIYMALAKRNMLLGCVIAIALYISIVSDKYYVATKSPNRYGLKIDSKHTPLGAVNFIKQYNIKGTAFSDYFISSYLLWALYPNFRSYIDLRDLDIFPAKFFDDYFKMYNEPDKFDALDKQYSFNYVIVAQKQLQGLQRKLYWGEGFNMIYADEMAVIFLKNSKDNEHLNNDLTIQKLFSNNGGAETPAWASVLSKLLNPAFNDDEEEHLAKQPIYAAEFYGQIGQHPLAIKQLQPVIGNFENDAEAQQTLGDLYMNYARSSNDPKIQKQRLDSSFYYLSNAEEIDAKLPAVHSSLGNWYIATGNYDAAEKQLEQCADLDNTNDYTYYTLGFCKRMIWINTRDGDKRDEMLDAMKRSLSLNPANTKADLYVAEAEIDKGKISDAKKHLKKAIGSGNIREPEEAKLLAALKVKAGL
jgi:Tfp pilus assembly protein PilF